MSCFRPDTGGQRWSLVQVRLFSRAVGREGRCRQMSLACVGSAGSVPATLGLAPLPACVLSPSTLLRLPAALQGAGPELRALPRSKPLRFRFSGPPQRRRLGWACVLCLPRPSSSGSQAHSLQVQRDFSPPHPRLSFQACLIRCALCLFWGADLWL